MSTLAKLAEELQAAATGYDEYSLRATAEEVAAKLLALAAPPTCITVHPTGAQLDALPADRRVQDSTGDVWFKLPDGRWSFKNVTTSNSAHLVNVFGPVRVLEETK